MIPSSLLFLHQQYRRQHNHHLLHHTLLIPVFSTQIRSIGNIDDDLLLNENNNNDAKKAKTTSKVVVNNNNKKPRMPSSAQNKAPLPPPSSSGGNMVRPKLMMKPAWISGSGSSSSTTTTTNKKPTTSTSTSSTSTSSSKPPSTSTVTPTQRISLKSVNTGMTNKSSTMTTMNNINNNNNTTPLSSKSSASSSSKPKPKLQVISSDQVLDATTLTDNKKNNNNKTQNQQQQPTEEDLEKVVEACELIVPAQGGMSLSELFAILPVEDRAIVKKSSFKLLSKFLRSRPEKFAISPNNIVVVLVSAYDGDQTTAANFAKVAESLTPSALDYVSATGISTKKEKLNKNSTENNNNNSNSSPEFDESLLLPLSDETLELLSKNCNPFFSSEYKPVTAQDELQAIEKTFAHAGDHHRLVLDKVPPADLVTLISTTQSDGRIKTPSEFKTTVDEIFENVLSTQTLVKFIPPWFVPAPEVVSMMGEGYTEDHFDQFFGDSSAVEVVTLAGKKFVRLHGGNKHKTLVDFDNAEAREAEKIFEHYKPDPTLVLEILKVAPPRGQWVSLFDLWNRLPPEVQERFPFQGPHSLTYFAQMQHIFSFSPNETGGRICIPHGLPGHLQWDSTPFVKQLHAVFNGLLNGKTTFVADILSVHFPKTSPSRKILREPFLRGLILARAVHGATIDPSFAFSCDVEALEPSQIEDLMRIFVSLHQNIFAYKEESMLAAQQEKEYNNHYNNDNDQHQQQEEIITPESIQNKHGRSVLLRFEFEAFERHKLDLPQQIELAIQKGNNKMARKLKRRLLILQQPDNPYLEEENLAKAISEFLPPDRSISWPRLKKNLPQEIVDLMPAERKKFMTKWPQYFKKFDVGVLHNHNVHLQHPHLPPPPGAFRQAGEYTEEELLSAMGQILLRGPKNVAALCSAMPDGIYDSLRLKFGGVAQAVQRHPEFFALVIKDVRNKDLRTAIVTLIQVPNLQVVEDNIVESEKAAEENRNEISELHKEKITATGFESETTNDDDGVGGKGGGGGVGRVRSSSSSSSPETDIWGEVIGETLGGGGTGGVEKTATMSSNFKQDEEGSGNEQDLWSQAATEVATSSSTSSSSSLEHEGKSTDKHHHQEFQDDQVNLSGW